MDVRMDGRTDVRMDGRKISPFYSPTTTQKLYKAGQGYYTIRDWLFFLTNLLKVAMGGFLVWLPTAVIQNQLFHLVKVEVQPEL